jgi:SAM-dependent methyltransferase
MKTYQQDEKNKRDAHASRYDEWFLRTKGLLFDLCERQAFVQAVKNDNVNSIIDIGSGTGRVTESLLSLVQRIVAIDFSWQSLSVLNNKRLKNCSAVCTDISFDLPFKNYAFDLAVSCQVLPQLQFDELLGAVREVNRILKPQGLFVFSGYNLHSWRYKGAFRSGNFDWLMSKRFSISDICAVAAHSNFDIVACRYYKTLPLKYLHSHRWLAVDRVLCTIPWVNKRLSGYILVIFRKKV